MRHKIFQNTSKIPLEDWDQVLKGTNLYLSMQYLQVLETTLKEQLLLFYSISYKNEIPVLITVFQLVTFIDKREQSHKSVVKILSDTKSRKQSFKMNMLVCGNVFADGEHGFVATQDVSDKEVVQELVTIAQKIKKSPNINENISASLFKEFWPSSSTKMDELINYSYKDFNIDVNMVLDIHPSWNTFNMYLQSMKTKFRTKANSAYKRSKAVVIKSLYEDEIIQHKERIDTLFSNVVNKSQYSFGKMNATVFAGLKGSLQSNFSFTGIFLENKLVGFSIAYFHNQIMEAGYVGLDYTVNIDFAIYQRILYNYVEQAITRKVKQLQLGRTSELIKSALGARPVEMKLYAKHKKPLSNLIMGAVLNKLSPSDYELRRPFKSGFEESI